MKYSAIQTELRRQPFRPFRINMNNGQSCIVRHPELIKAALSEIYIFRPSESDEMIPETVVATCSMDNIATIEPVHGSPA